MPAENHLRAAAEAMTDKAEGRALYSAAEDGNSSVEVEWNRGYCRLLFGRRIFYK